MGTCKNVAPPQTADVGMYQHDVLNKKEENWGRDGTAVGQPAFLLAGGPGMEPSLSRLQVA